MRWRRYRKLHEHWEKLIGSSVDFSLEHRVFNSVSIISMIALFVTMVVNFLLHLERLGVLLAVILTVQGIFYYRSRFRKKFQSSILVYAGFSYLLLTINYYYNSGINGPTVYWFFLTFIFLVAITDKKYYWVWSVLHLSIVWAMLTIEYHYPDVIEYTYRDKQDRFIDILFSYITSLVVICYITYYIRENYRRQKNLAEEKALAFEAQSLRVMAQNEQLEHLNEEKNKLFSIVSHDLRSPLDSIRGYFELLTIQDLDEKDRMNLQREILALTQNTSDMLSNLLSWSKAQMDGPTVNLQTLNISDTLQRTLSISKTIASKKQINLLHTIDHDTAAIADADMLQLIVRNLLTNAIKFTDPGGEIRVYLKENRERYIICIKDTGKGISYDKQQEIFSLKTVPTTGTANEKGVGLGLALCKDFVMRQNGDIWFDSNPGNGTEFYVAIQRHQAAMPQN